MCGAQTDIATFKMYSDAACTTPVTGQENTVVKLQQTGTNKCVHMAGDTETGFAIHCHDGKGLLQVYEDTSCTSSRGEDARWAGYTADEAYAFITGGGCLAAPGGAADMFGQLEAPVSAEWGIGCPGGSTLEASGVASFMGEMERLRDERGEGGGEHEHEHEEKGEVVNNNEALTHFEVFSDEGCATKMAEGTALLYPTGTGKCFQIQGASEGPPTEKYGIQVVCESGKTHIKFYDDMKCSKPMTETPENFDFSEITPEDVVLFLTAGKCLKQPVGACHPDDAPCNTWAKLKTSVSADWAPGCAPAPAPGTSSPAAANGGDADGAMLQSMSVSLGLVLALLWQI
jgi:hypothetical protein